MLAGRCRCGAGKFLRCGCAGARENELPVPRAGSGQRQAPPGTALGGIGTRQKGGALGPGTAGVMSWHHQGGFILNPAVFVVPSPLGSEHSELRILWGVGGTGSPRGFALAELMGLKEYSLGEEKKRLGASMGLRSLISCVGSGKHRLLSLARRKLGASGRLEAWPCRLPALGHLWASVCLQNICCP